MQHCVVMNVWDNLQGHLNLPRQGRQRSRCQVGPDVISDNWFFLFGKPRYSIFFMLMIPSTENELPTRRKRWVFVCYPGSIQNNVYID